MDQPRKHGSPERTKLDSVDVQDVPASSREGHHDHLRGDSQNAWFADAAPSNSHSHAGYNSSEGTPVPHNSISNLSVAREEHLPTRTKRVAVSFDEAEGHVEIIRLLREMRADLKEDLHQVRMDLGRTTGRMPTAGSVRSSNLHHSFLGSTFSPITSTSASRLPSKSTVGTVAASVMPAVGPTHSGLHSSQPHWWMERGVRSYQVSSELRGDYDPDDDRDDSPSPQQCSSKHQKCSGPLSKVLAQSHKKKKGHQLDKFSSVLPVLSNGHDSAENSCASPTVTIVPPNLANAAAAAAVAAAAAQATSQAGAAAAATAAAAAATAASPTAPQKLPPPLALGIGSSKAATTTATTTTTVADAALMATILSAKTPSVETQTVLIPGSSNEGALADGEYMDNAEPSIGARSAFSAHTYAPVASSRMGNSFSRGIAAEASLPISGSDTNGAERKAYLRSCSRGDGHLEMESSEPSLRYYPTNQRALPRRIALKIVRSGWFDIIGSIAILCNAVAIGWQIDYCAQNSTEKLPRGAMELEVAFSIVFLVELIVRMVAFYKAFFTMAGCGWNVFDLIVVTVQLAEEIFLAIVPEDEGQTSFPVPITLVRMLRILRLVRIVRVVRLLKYMQELRTIVVSTMASMKPLMSTVALLALIVYIVGCYFTQVTLTHRVDCQNRNCDAEGLVELDTLYGSLGTTSLHLFQVVTGGMDWKDLSEPLATQISPWLPVVFSLYVMFTSVALMNIVTGVFVETALQRGREDKDVYMINTLREVFKRLDQNQNGLITWNELSSHLREPYVVSFFKDIDIDISEASGLFHLLDRDGSGVLDADEFLTGCLRLRGPAKALDQQLIMRELAEQRRIVGRLAAQAEDTFFGAEDVKPCLS